MSNDLNSNSRSGYRAKRKKTNLVLNSLIVVVLLLIIFVGYNIFVSGNDNASDKKEITKTEQTDTSHKEKKAKEDQEVTKDDKTSEQATEDDQEGDEATTPEKADESQEVVSEGGSTGNVIKTIENPSWKPVGTTQTGEHTPVFDGVDWQEMLNAITYATGLDQSNMKVYWLGSDKTTTNAAVGTVYSTDQQQKYKVFIQWVDGEGWMPTKVEELAELER
ncbi:YrrS family protein [Neobacillus jeddahensis]|uniref:YrrS family protein n=1 Tax=Neobacillus jeddahensis TaxID=1461580 RepID=UPI0005906A1F|nr:YrrS family protein [Neobacillus jeddahensis]